MRDKRRRGFLMHQKLNTTFLDYYRRQKWDEATAFLTKLEGLPELDLSNFVVYTATVSAFIVNKTSARTGMGFMQQLPNNSESIL